ncbi:MAG: DUF1574 family protein, partial [Leptonema sp. (in: Bacteria)]|nr:DUF1574 family protein [Leptonema sp. (in: bacteria)]
MDLFKHRILWTPLILFGFIFLVDKVFQIDYVKDRTLLFKKVEPDLYSSRQDLLNIMIQNSKKSDKKIGVILGSSRSAEFDTLEIGRLLQNTDTYNFSVPMGGIAHAYYYATKILNSNIRPAFFMVEADRVNFGQPSLSFAIDYGFDPSFVLKNTNLLNPDNLQNGGFRPDEADTYFLKESFALYRYPVDFANIIQNYKPLPALPSDKTKKANHLEFRWANRKLQQISNQEHLGAIPNPLKIEATDEQLQKDAELVKGRVFGDGSTSKTQLLFFKRLLDIAQKNEIPILFYKPVVSYQFQKIIQETDAGFQQSVIQ